MKSAGGFPGFLIGENEENMLPESESTDCFLSLINEMTQFVCFQNWLLKVPVIHLAI